MNGRNRTIAAAGALAVGAVLGGLSATVPSASAVTAAPAGAYYRNCGEAKYAGVTPIKRGQEGYRTALDRNGNGIACENGSEPEAAVPHKKAPKAHVAPKKKATPAPQKRPQTWGSVQLP
ncbi:excalibur calcium-binding domain-containing protein [Gordonia soli]|uniref:Excalibur calcium-binding domain-containing protein n=1 Tax=Gordonia soli NBRC 108243 TaxID=1223545 RepID=M0QQG9_9ACTN|nr:excalibur calcium-binding domain-containing protein [Gordonia soli]GAC70910.1 hypothetical protein GS4_43_00370 [Gordonia soli NBRC 108243]